MGDTFTEWKETHWGVKRKPAAWKLNVPDVPLERTANRLQTAKYAYDVYDMVMQGIEIIKVVHEAATLTNSMRLVSTVAEHSQVVGGVVQTTSRAAAALEVANVLGVYVAFWLELAGAHAAAMAAIRKDNVLRGASRGVVLGADDAPPAYVQQHFWQHGKLTYPHYPQLEEGAKNLHNIALVSGYAQGRQLSKNQKRSFFRDLFDNFDRDKESGTREMLFGEDVVRGPIWKKEFYFSCSAKFRQLHLK